MKVENFLINRLDQDCESSQISKIYDIDSLKEIKEKKIVLSVIKKLILCTNFKSRWSLMNFKIILIILHLFSFLIATVYSFMKSENSYNTSTILLVETCLIAPFWIFGYFFYFDVLKKIQKLTLNIGEYIAFTETQRNSHYKFTIDEDLNLTIVPKKLVNPTENFSNFLIGQSNINFDYVVSTNIEISTDFILYKKIIPPEDLAIITNIYTFINREAMNKMQNLFTEKVLPSAFLLIIFLKYETTFSLKRWLIILGILILIIIVHEKTYSEYFRKRFNDFMEELNKDLLKKGKFAYRYRTTLLIFTLNSQTKNFTKEILDNYVRKNVIKINTLN